MASSKKNKKLGKDVDMDEDGNDNDEDGDGAIENMNEDEAVNMRSKSLFID